MAWQSGSAAAGGAGQAGGEAPGVQAYTLQGKLSAIEMCRSRLMSVE